MQESKSALLLLAVVLVSFAFSCLSYQQETGYVPVNSQYNAQLFYWLFESQSSPSTDPLVLWLTGGPGCSSELAVLFENGPIQVNSDGSGTVNNSYGWNKFSNILFVDQPAPTGFATCSQEYITNEKQVVDEMLVFLSGFIGKHPEYENRDFYLVGESYAGHYVPAVAAGIVTATGAEIGKENLVKFNLMAIGIGNGWVDPYIQYGAYGSFAYQNQLISENVWGTMNASYVICEQDLTNQNWSAADSDCASIMQDVLSSAGNINVYNIKLQCIGQLCYDFDNIITYLNNPSTQQSLGVSNINWQPCDFTVNSAFYADRYESYKSDIPIVLANGVRVVIYNGDLDLICNWVGGLQWSLAMQWPGQNSLNSAVFKPWLVNGVAAGSSISAQGFTFLRVFNAGHMVPHDQPLAALQLLSNVISGQPFY